MTKTNNIIRRQQDLIENPSARIPICLCLDVSGSMSGAPIAELNRGVQLFYDAVSEDELARYAAEIAVVTFGENGNNATCRADFAGVHISPAPPILEARGSTPLGEGVNMALDMLETRKQEYRDKGVDYYQPWLVLMTDGYPNGAAAELERAVARTAELARKKNITVFPLAIGPNADTKVLARFAGENGVMQLNGLRFREFFAWLSRSVSAVSVSMPGELVPPDLDGIRGWGELL